MVICMELNDTSTYDSKIYFRAFYRGNFFRFICAIILTILNIPGSLIGSWLLGRVIDIIAIGNWAYLKQTLFFCIAFIIVMLLLSTAMYRAKCTFIYNALAQYKSFAFQNLSKKSISAFSRENTGRYISVLTNDVNSIEENYLKNLFFLLYYILLFFGTLAMMFYYSPFMTFATVILGSLPLAVSLLMGKELTEREKAVSDKNEDFVSQLKDLLAGFSVIKIFKAERDSASF